MASQASLTNIITIFRNEANEFTFLLKIHTPIQIQNTHAHTNTMLLTSESICQLNKIIEAERRGMLEKSQTHKTMDKVNDLIKCL